MNTDLSQLDNVCTVHFKHVFLTKFMFASFKENRNIDVNKYVSITHYNLINLFTKSGEHDLGHQ